MEIVQRVICLRKYYYLPMFFWTGKFYVQYVKDLVMVLQQIVHYETRWKEYSSLMMTEILRYQTGLHVSSNDDVSVYQDTVPRDLNIIQILCFCVLRIVHSAPKVVLIVSWPTLNMHELIFRCKTLFFTPDCIQNSEKMLETCLEN